MGRDTIKSLSERQQARDKVAIWFGSRDNFVHPFKEVTMNGVDEITNNFESGEVFINLSNDCKTMKIIDTGRGIPIEGETPTETEDGRTELIPNYKLLLLKLFAGTNYDNNANGKITTGANGVGLTVTNYTSKHFKVVSHRPSGTYTIEFNEGGILVYEPIRTDNTEGKHGTEITFTLDDEVFTGTTYNIDEILDVIKNLAGVAHSVTFTIEHNGSEHYFHYDSLQQFFEENVENRTSKPAVGHQKTFKKEAEPMPEIQFTNSTPGHDPGGPSASDLAAETNLIQCIISTSSTPLQKSFLNSTYLSEGGSINRGIVYGVRDYVNKHIKDKKLIDKKLGEITPNDIEESISFVCNFLSTNVEFTNQTKLSTNKSLYMRIAKEYIQEVLEFYKIEQPKEFEKFINHILEVQKFNGKAMAAKNSLKKKLSEKVDNIINRIEGLIDCKLHDLTSEIFIAEGKSALGSIITARNPLTQAGIAIRGKILNCLKADYDEIFKSETVMSIIKALGCGIETDKKNKDLGCFDISALRYGKIIIATDADPDGYQIACLLLTLFYRLCPTLIKEGHVYIALTPLFEIKDLKNKKYYYAYSEEEKDEIVSDLQSQGIKYQVNRNKGLGEVDAEVMSRTGVNPETRNIMKVTFDDAEQMVKAFDDWMGNNVDNRKDFIETELNKYDETA